jgi:hypothetical protein
MKYLQQILMTTFLLFLIPLLSFSQVKSSQVYFDVAKHELTESAKKVLDQMYADVLQKGYSEIQVSGFTDADGGNAYNQNLSLRRTNAVTQYLIAKGLEPNQFVKNWYGETKSDGELATADVKQKNRRVDIQVKLYDFNTFENVLKELQGDRTQKFVLKDDGAQTITCSGGTSFNIATRAFKNEEGKSVKNSGVQLLIQEFPSMEDAFLFNLSTQTENGILESGGMLKIDIFKNGQKLSPNGPNTFVVNMPTQNRQMEMEVFVAEDVTNQNAVGWQSTSEPFNLVNDNIPVASVKMNQKVLDNIQIKVDQHTVKNEYNLDFVIPHSPSKLNAPKAPRKPVLTNAKKEFGFWMTLFTTKAYRQKKVDALNAIKQNDYQEKWDAYKGKKDRYDEVLRKQEQNKKDFEHEVRQYKDQLAQMIKEINEDQIKVRNQYDQERCKRALKTLKNMNRRGFTTRNIIGIFQDNATNFASNQHSTTLMNLNRKRGEMYEVVRILNQEKLKDFEGKNLKNVVQTRVEKMIKRIGKWRYGWLQSKNVNVQSVELLKKHPELREEMKKTGRAFMRANRETNRKILKDPQSVYQAELSAVGFINCDRFVEIEPNQMATLYLGPKVEGRTSVFVEEYNSMLYPTVNKENQLVVRVPKSTSLKVVRLEMKQGQPHFGIKHVNLTGDKSVLVSTQMTALGEIQSALENL